jgi:hypothetical protein
MFLSIEKTMDGELSYYMYPKQERLLTSYILMLDTKLILFKHWTNVTNEIRIESISNFFLSYLTGGK